MGKRMGTEVEILKNFFETREEALEDIKKTGFWPTTLASPPTEALPLHWHDCEIHGYVIEGHTSLLVGREGRRVDIGPGDKLVLPPRSIHAEGAATEPVTYIVSLPDTRSLGEAIQLNLVES